MKIAYLDCASGISGDMTLGALIDAGADLATIQAGIDSLGLPSCELSTSTVTKKGFRATQLVVHYKPEHVHRHLHSITKMISASILTTRQKELANAIFLNLAQAEAKVHGSTLEKVHFHEVGAVDSIADIVGTAIAFDLLGLDKIVCSAIPTGTGFIQIAHGRCSIPAPATAELLRGIPLADFIVEGELTTPTGAAIVKTLVSEFGSLPPMKIEIIGLGAGQKDFDHANVLRILIGETVESGQKQNTTNRFKTDTITLLETNLDDTSGEQLGYCLELLWEAGALDVTLTSVMMKKNRPGVLLQVQAKPAEADRLATILFNETTTLGIRQQQIERLLLPRKTAEITTRWGIVTGKVAILPDGSKRFSPEYEACRKIARAEQIPLVDVYKEAAHLYTKNASTCG